MVAMEASPNIISQIRDERIISTDFVTRVGGSVPCQRGGVQDAVDRSADARGEEYRNRGGGHRRQRHHRRRLLDREFIRMWSWRTRILDTYRNRWASRWRTRVIAYS
jgi:hypothetical protein